MVHFFLLFVGKFCMGIYAIGRSGFSSKCWLNWLDNFITMTVGSLTRAPINSYYNFSHHIFVLSKHIYYAILLLKSFFFFDLLCNDFFSSWSNINVRIFFLCVYMIVLVFPNGKTIKLKGIHFVSYILLQSFLFRFFFFVTFHSLAFQFNSCLEMKILWSS